jgi:hypothetical protein
LPAGVVRPEPTLNFVDRARLPVSTKVLSAAKSRTGTIWLVTDAGASYSDGGPFVPITKHLSTPSDLRVKAVAGDRLGNIWAATNKGLLVTDGKGHSHMIDARDGVPYEDMTCLHLAANGDVWGGTKEGAWRLRAGQFRYFWGRRWLPGNRLESIWTDQKGRAWLETDGGFACIEEKPTTLAQKAAHFDAITQARHNRRGFISEIHLKTRGDPSLGYRFEISDNDGLWNSIYVGAMAFRYAATKDTKALEQARQALAAMFDLERLSGIPGYPARAVATDEELKRGVDGVNLEETVRVPEETDKIWYRSPVDKTVWCKGDTSSDEMDGHYFAWYVYHDLVADAGEQQGIAAIVRRATDHILSHNYTLVGHTGRKTRWGIWAPELINREPFYITLQPINSLEMLAYLTIASHITGDAKYARAYDELVQKHHYLLNTLQIRRGLPGRWMGINHSDDEMLFMMYYAILQLEKAPDRRRILTESITRAWEGGGDEQGVQPERSPLYNFIYGATTGKPCAAEEGIQNLRDWPWDMTSWTVKNSQRSDVRIKTDTGGRRFHTELDRLLPPSERCLERWNGNPWKPDGGNDGLTEDDGAAWMLAYWLGVYHGYLPKG